MSMQTARRRPEKTADGLERISGAGSLIDVLERVLDKGIVIDPWLRASSVSIDLLTYKSRQRRRTRKTKTPSVSP